MLLAKAKRVGKTSFRQVLLRQQECVKTTQVCFDVRIYYFSLARTLVYVNHGRVGEL